MFRKIYFKIGSNVFLYKDQIMFKRYAGWYDQSDAYYQTCEERMDWIAGETFPEEVLANRLIVWDLPKKYETQVVKEFKKALERHYKHRRKQAEDLKNHEALHKSKLKFIKNVQK